MIAAFSDVFADVTKQGTKLQTSEYLASGKYPIIDQGQDDIAGYTDREDGLFTDVPAIIFGDHTRIVKYVDMPFFLGADGVKVLKAEIPDVDCRYLYYAVSAVKIPNTGYNRHFKWLKEAQIPLPDISTQRRIADTLDKVSEGIGVCRRMLGELDLMVKAKFQEMFGDYVINPKHWNLKCLEDIAEVGSSKRVFVEELQGTGIPFYRGTEVGALAEGKNIEPELFITEEHYNKLCEATGKPQIGDLLMPSICPDGRIWVVNTDKPFYFKDGRVLWVHSIVSDYNPVFLLYALKDRIMSDYSSIASGTTFAELKIFALKKCRIFEVPLELQNQFVAFVAEIDKSKLTIQGILDKMEMEKLALMQEYFG